MRHGRREKSRAPLKPTALFLAATIILTGGSVVAMKGSTQAVAEAVEPTPAIQTAAPAPVMTPEPSEEPGEAEKIEAALVAQGYYRDDIPMSYELQDALHTAAEATGIPYELAVAVVKRETEFQNISGDNGAAIGYMQVHPAQHWDRMERLGVTDLWDPAQNFLTGCDYLAENIEKYGFTHQAITSYNRGPGGARTWNREHGTFETGYSIEVMGNYQALLDGREME